MVKKIIPFLVVVILSSFALVPLLSPGFFPMHDDTQPTRVHLMTQALDQGQFPVRWVDGLGYGYGYPLFNFYSPLPYYFGTATQFFGIDALQATKLMIGVGFLLAGITMYMLGYKLWGIAGGLIVSVLYTYTPYHAVQMYVRGAVGELWAYAFLPLLFLGYIYVEKKRPLEGLLIGALGLSGVILSHNITALFLMILLVMWLMVEVVHFLISRNKLAVSYISGVLLLGLCIAAFFWMPALTESQFTKVEELAQGTNHYSNHFLYLDQLWDSPWGYAGSAPGRADGMSFKVGKLHLLLAGVGALSLLVSKLKSKDSKLFWLCSVGLLLTTFLMLGVSQVVWDMVPWLAFAQYPWRLLVFVSLFISVTSGFLIHLIRERLNKNFTGIVIALFAVTILFNHKYFRPQFINDKSFHDYTDEQNVKWTISRISHEYLPKDFPVPQTQNEIVSQKIMIGDDIIVESSEVRPHFISLSVLAKQTADIVFGIAYFPGWRAVIDTNPVHPSVNEGRISLTVPEGRHKVTVFLDNTPVRTIANLVSFVAFIIYGSLLVHSKKTHNA